MDTTQRRGIRHRRIIAGLVVLAALGALAAGESWWLHRHRGTRGVGDRVDDFTLPDLQGRPVSLSGLLGTHKAVVLVFTGTDCPVGNLYMPRLVELGHAYKGRGVAFLAINSNAHESVEEIAEHARTYQVDFPVLKDDRNRVADLLRIERTCETLVIDQGGWLRYRGAVDDQYIRGARKDRPTRAFLAEAIDAVLAGSPVEVTLTSVLSCPIERVEPERAKRRSRPPSPEIARIRRSMFKTVEVGPVDYAHDVAPILQSKCLACHRPHEAAPFALLDYDDAKRWSESIYEVVDQGLMPPWYADPRIGNFANDRSLTDRERAVLLAWVDQGAPPGDLSAVPEPPEFPEGWTIGEPDIVIEMPEAFEVPAEGVLEIQKFFVATNFKQDVWVQAVQAMPGDRAVVHHICAFVVDPEHLSDRGGDRETRRRDKPELVCYAPGDMPSVFPEGVAKKIPAGAILEFQVHYTPIGIPRFDRSSIGLILSRGPVHRLAVTRGASNRDFVIPAGAPNHEVRASYTLLENVHLLSLTPHMHFRGKDFRYTAIYPDGRREPLLSVPYYDFNWQNVYRLAEPKFLPKGTRIECLAHFDNSKDNPLNPDPTKDVRWGDQSWDEMMIGYLDYCIDLPTARMATGDRSRPHH